MVDNRLSHAADTEICPLNPGKSMTALPGRPQSGPAASPTL
jgi:hypothetical protein